MKIAVSTYWYRFVEANALTLRYCCWSFIIIFINYIKNMITFQVKKNKLTPPSCLRDPKYGVHKYLKVNNIKLHYVESGDPSKPLMIFLHGFPEFWYSWRYQILEFQKDYWCIAVDMRGYADSERPEDKSSYKMDLLVADIRDLIRQLGREKCILISHDWGGVVAYHFRDVYPEALEAMVSLASMSLQALIKQIWSNPAQKKKSWYVFLYRIPVVPECLLQMDTETLFKRLMMVPGKTAVTDEDIECYTYWFGKQDGFKYPINYYRANFEIIPPKKSRSDLKIPTLAALANKDIAIGKDVLNELQKEYEHIETTVVAGCGHFMQQEEPDKTNNLIRDFLRKHNL